MKYSLQIMKKIIIGMLILSIILSGMHVTIDAQADIDSSITTPGTSHGLMAKLYASKYGLTGLFSDVDLYAIAKIDDANLNIVDIASQLHTTKLNIKRVRMDGYIIPRYSEKYTFSTNHDDRVKLWINNHAVIINGTSNPIMLTANETYRLELELDSNNDNDLRIYWESAAQSREVIPSSQCIVPAQIDNQETPLANRDDAPSGDLDNDGIPNSWEKQGFTVINGIIIPYDASFGTPKYVTDYAAFSTDGDPFSDLAEATGIGMDRSVKSPGDHPLVPAYPIIEFMPTSVRIVPNIINSEGEVEASKDSRVIKVTSIASEGNDYGGYTKSDNTTGTEVGTNIKVDSAKGEGTVTGYSKVTTQGGQKYNSNSATSTENKKYDAETLGITSTSSTSSTQTYSTTNYASLIINGYYKNSGLATAHNVQPLINVGIDKDVYAETDSEGTLIKSFAPILGQEPDIIGPHMTYPAKGSLQLSLSHTEGKVPTSIRLTKKQTDKLEQGFPFQIGVSTQSSDFGLPNQDKVSWSTYLTDIDDKCATIRFQIPGSRKIIRKVYAGTNTGGISLYDALIYLYNAKETSEGNLIIEDEELSTDLGTSSWGIYASGSAEQIATFIDNIESGESINLKTIQLSPGMEVDVFKKDANSPATILTSYYSVNDEKVYSVVIPSQSPISSIQASLSVLSEEQHLSMVLTEGSRYTYESSVVRYIDSSYNNRVVATSENGTVAEQAISIDADYVKTNARNGLKYKPMHSIVARNRTELRTLIENHPEYKYFTMLTGADLSASNFIQTNEKTLSNYEKQFSNSPIKTVIGNTEINHQAQTKHEVPWGKSVIPDPNVEQLLNPIQGRYFPNHWGTDGLFTPIFRVLYKKDGLQFASSMRRYNIFPWSLFNIEFRYLTYNITPYASPYSYVENTNSGDFYIEGEIIRNKGVNNREILGTFSNRCREFHTTDIARSLSLSENIIPEIRIILKDIKVYNSTKPARHTQTAIVSRDDILEYLTPNENALFDGRPNPNAKKPLFDGMVITGVFTDANDGKVFIPSSPNRNKESIVYGTNDILLQERNVDTVLMNVSKNANSEGQDIKLGRYWIGLNTGDATQKHQDLVFAETNAAGNINKQFKKGNIDVEILGYFKDLADVDQDQRYWQYWIPQEKIRSTIMPDASVGISEKSFTMDYRKLNVHGLPVKPKAYILKVDQHNLGSKGLKLTINNQEIHMDIGDKKDGVDYHTGYDHTGYVYVTANIEDAYTLDLELDIKNKVKIEVDGDNVSYPEDIDVNVDPSGNLLNPDEIADAGFTIPESPTRRFVPIQSQITHGAVSLEVVGFMYEN